VRIPRNRLRIYIYELPTPLTRLGTFTNSPGFTGHDNIYLAYQKFTTTLMHDWSVRTENPWCAHSDGRNLSPSATPHGGPGLLGHRQRPVLEALLCAFFFRDFWHGRSSRAWRASIHVRQRQKMLCRAGRPTFSTSPPSRKHSSLGRDATPWCSVLAGCFAAVPLRGGDAHSLPGSALNQSIAFSARDADSKDESLPNPGRFLGACMRIPPPTSVPTGEQVPTRRQALAGTRALPRGRFLRVQV
jgi:hypothetical protein